MTNRRNAYLLSEHLEEALGVPSARGFIQFTALSEEGGALNGKTMAQMLEEDADVVGGCSMAIVNEKPAGSTRRKGLGVKVSSTH